MDSELRDVFVASRALERQVMAIAKDSSLNPQERGGRIRKLIEQGGAASLSDAWVAAGRPEPLGFRYNQQADRAEWFDGWVEVESLVLEEQERSGRTREQIKQLVLAGKAPFADDLEAEELGAIYRSNEDAPQE